MLDQRGGVRDLRLMLIGGGIVAVDGVGDRGRICVQRLFGLRMQRQGIIARAGSLLGPCYFYLLILLAAEKVVGYFSSSFWSNAAWASACCG